MSQCDAKSKFSAVFTSIEKPKLQKFTKEAMTPLSFELLLLI